MLTLFTARKHGGSIRFDGNRFETGFTGFEDFAGPGNGAAGTNPCNQEIHLTIGIAPDLLGGCAAMDLGVGRVLKLLRDKITRIGRGHLFRLVNSTIHAFAAGS